MELRIAAAAAPQVGALILAVTASGNSTYPAIIDAEYDDGTYLVRHDDGGCDILPRSHILPLEVRPAVMADRLGR